MQPDPEDQRSPEPGQADGLPGDRISEPSSTPDDGATPSDGPAAALGPPAEAVPPEAARPPADDVLAPQMPAPRGPIAPPGQAAPADAAAEPEAGTPPQGEAWSAGTDDIASGTGEAGASPLAGAEAVTDAEWLDRICPYLLSEDGTWRSTRPDAGHRCTAQDPPGTLPTAFQERFCLTDQHTRCEMYKYAHGARSAELEQEGIPADQVKSARFRPSVRSVPLALGPSATGADASGGSRRSWLVVIGIGAVVVIVVLLLAVVFGGGSDDGGGVPGESAGAAAATAPTPTRAPTPVPTPRATPEPGATSRPDVSDVSPRLARYEVQEGEALLKIAEAFGTTRQRIKNANEGMADQTPFVEAGDRILVPVGPSVSDEEVMTLEGFIEFVEGG